MQARGRAFALMLAAATGLGCHDQAAPESSGAPMEMEPAESESGNRPPRVEAVRLEPAEPVEGDRVRAVVRARDPDGDELDLSYSWRVAGQRVAEDANELTLRHVSKGDAIEVVVVASDGIAESQPGRAERAVGNQRPRLLSLEVDPSSEVARDGTIVAAPHGEDPDGDSLELRYVWRVDGQVVQTTGPSFSARGLKWGDRIELRVTAYDGETESEPLVGIVKVANAAPEILSSPGEVERDGEEGLFRYALEARDPDGDRLLRYRLRSAPEGMRLDPVTGELTWRPSSQQAGSHRIEVAVVDSGGAASIQQFELNVAPLEDPAADALAPAAPAR